MPLTPEQRLERLTTRTAEITLWRVRETVDIDGWTFEGEPIAVGAPWPRRAAVVHLAAKAEVPTHWPLADARLSLNVGGESLVSLTFEHGEVVRFGLDPHHEELPLAGRRFSIETESAPRLPFGQPVAAPRLGRAALVWLDAPVCRLERRLTLIAETVEALKDHEASAHLLDAAEEALRALQWPSATADYVARVAPSRAQQTIWRLPETIAHPAALGAAERASVEAACERLTARLKELQLRFPPQGEVALSGHAHIDLAWLWPYGETRRKLRRTFHTALSLARSSADFRFNQSTAHYYAQVEEDDPALFARIRDEVAAGRWETLGGMWVEPDTNIPTGESLARQILYGQRYFERAFGVRHKVCWLPDSFGFSPALPQLLRQGGLDSFFTIKVNWSETNRFPYDLFWWEGLDGSRVLAHTFDNPIRGYNGDVRPGAIAPTWKNFRGKTAHPQTLLAVGYGDGGGGVTPDMIARETELRDFPALPKARWSTVHGFFAAAHASAAEKTLPVWSGEIYLELHRATLTTQGRVKRKHRAAELLKNEFHDILPGSSIREVYEEAEAELDGVIARALAAQQAGMAAVVASLPAGEAADALAVVNPSLSARPLRVLLGDDEAIATDESVPPLGVAVFDRASLRPLAGLSVSASHLENAFLRATFGPDGAIESLVHKPTGREALAGRGNQLWVYPQDKPRDWDAWDLEEDYWESGEELREVQSVEVVERGPHRASLRVKRGYRASTIAQTYVLWANSRRLDVVTEIDWRDRRTLLRTLTPAAVRARHATFECACGVVQRPTHANTSWDAAMFEVPGHRFADLSEPGFGVALLNDAKYGHSVRGDVLGLSLVRSPVYPDPLADEGAHAFTYALMPHAGDWHEGGVREEAEDLNQPLLAASARSLAPGVHEPIAISGIAAALSALKPAEDGDGLVLRVYEPAGARGPFAFTLPAGWRNAGPVDLLEEPATREAAHDLMPFEIRSWRLARD
jgi:alpha-mannosidase